jgi:hypothetical protein
MLHPHRVAMLRVIARLLPELGSPLMWSP